MKKLMFLIFAGFCLSIEGKAALKYDLVFKIYFTRTSNGCSSCRTSVDFPVASSGTEYDHVSGKTFTVYKKNIDLNEIQKIALNFLNGSSVLSTQNITLTYPCMNETNKEVTVGDFKATYNINLKPITSSLRCYDSQNNLMIDYKFSQNKEIKISSSGYYSEFAGLLPGYVYANDRFEFTIGGTVYKYECSCGNLQFDGDLFASMLNTHNSDKPTLDFKTIVKNGPITVRHNPVQCDCPDDTDNRIIIHPQLSSPTITTIDRIQETCHGTGDGKLIIRFSRALYEDELLQVLIYGEDPVTVTPLSDSCEITNVQAGDYEITLAGKYPYKN